MVEDTNTNLEVLCAQISRCRICRDDCQTNALPHEPRPVLVASSIAKIALCGQAPGTRVHQSGIPFSDPSGERLRLWLGVGEREFYNRDKFAILPMGFCFPGLDIKGGDLPPRRECAAKWRTSLMEAMPQLELLLVIGIHAQAWHLGKLRKKNLTQTVTAWREFVDGNELDDGSSDGLADGVGINKPIMFPLPHPSWRNNIWLKKNPWFDEELLPRLREMIQSYLT